MKIAACTEPGCGRLYLNGFRLYRTPSGWRCVDHAGQTTGGNPALRQPSSEFEARGCPCITDKGYLCDYCLAAKADRAELEGQAE